MMMPAMIGGFAFGALSGLPVVQCLCCALMAGAGFVAAYLYSKKCAAAGVEFRPGQGALLGLLTAPFYAIGAAIVGGLFHLVMPTDPDQVDEILGQIEGADMPPEAAEMITKFLEMMMGAGGIIIWFLLSLFVGLVVVTIGGLIGGAVFRTQPVLPAPPSPMPPPPLEPPPPPPHMPSV
jgi:hypothetical protein